jgi:TorA maturation chaperone TorD
MPQQTPQAPRSSADPLAEEQARRASLYGLLAALLRDVPDDRVLDYTRQLEADDPKDKGELAVALGTLALAARHSSLASVREEYHRLFIGLGRGELVPFGSWYQTGFLMERPLALLRADLRQLGFERAEDVHEPEDHIAALCEVMSLLIQDGTEVQVQRQFFDSHIGNWAGAFFADLAQADSAVLYRSVARLGIVFLSLEATYLSLLD